MKSRHPLYGTFIHHSVLPDVYVLHIDLVQQKTLIAEGYSLVESFHVYLFHIWKEILSNVLVSERRFRRVRIGVYLHVCIFDTRVMQTARLNLETLRLFLVSLWKLATLESQEETLSSPPRAKGRLCATGCATNSET